VQRQSWIDRTRNTRTSDQAEPDGFRIGIREKSAPCRGKSLSLELAAAPGVGRSVSAGRGGLDFRFEDRPLPHPPAGV